MKEPEDMSRDELIGAVRAYRRIIFAPIKPKDCPCVNNDPADCPVHEGL